MIPFDFQLRTRIVFGAGNITKLGEIAGELGARRVILVSDAGVVLAGHAQRGLDSLASAGVEAWLFQQVHENPTTDDVDEGVRFARRHEPDLIVGLGGGSSMDCAKGINFVYSNGGSMHDYWGVGKALRPMLPMIAVPTTSGTGSEAQSFALISDAKTHAKMACGDKKASFRVAILDPDLTVTQPRRVTALTGIDALAHAAETFVTKRRNAISLFFSKEAWRLLSANFPRVLRDGHDLDARGGMQLGACFAGLAIENSMLGAAHALANPLTANYGIVHGQAIATMLPHVIRYNGEEHADWYHELYSSAAANGSARQLSPQEAVERLATQATEFAESAGLHLHLADQQVERSDLDRLASQAAEQWTGGFNPRPVDAATLKRLYEAAW